MRCFWAILAVLLLGVGLSSAVLGADGIAGDLERTRAENNRLKKQNDELRSKVNSLRQRLASLESRAEAAGLNDEPEPEPEPEPRDNRNDDRDNRDSGRNSGRGHGSADGFGQKARGASGSVRNLGSAKSFRGGGNVRLSKGDYDVEYDSFQITKGNTTFDGGGATLWYPASNHNGKGLCIYAQNVIVRNLRVRNSGDGILFGSSSAKGKARDILVENCSTTGNGDDGFSVAYDCRDITIRWCFIAGNARSVFMKYGGANLTMHHNILTHYWIRGPLVSGSEARIDFRNNLVQHWSMWGSRVESGARGDFVNNTWRLASWAGGKRHSALYSSGGDFYETGNRFEGCDEARGGERSPIVNGPSVPTQSASQALQAVLSNSSGAGCMPRDRIDTNYLNSRQRCPGGDPACGLQVDGCHGRH